MSENNEHPANVLPIDVPDPGGKTDKIGRRITFTMYEKMAQAYIHSDRTKALLVRMFGISAITSRKAIEKGWPEKGWPALAERAKVYDDEQRSAEYRRAYDLAETKTNIERQVLDSQIGVSRSFLAALADMMIKCQEAVPKATFSRTKKVKIDGVETEVELPPNAFSVAQAMAVIAGGYKNIASVLMEVVDRKMDKIKPGDKAPGTSTGRGWMNLSAEQLDHIAKTGNLPDGVSADYLFGLPGGK